MPVKRAFVIISTIISIIIIENKYNHPLDTFLNYLFLRQANEHIALNILGDIAIDTKQNGIIYTARYQSLNGKYLNVKLNDLIDTLSWSSIPSENIHIQIFNDKNYIYEVFYLEDTFINCILKEGLKNEE